ncbi:hypothetical protein [Allorhizocola rhizosphaerae]|uniref:hypothetical protein n=1 Tax=Allorhizocola rhizosphaerae TaxID=1872709 RepID=UPI000E3BD1A4|nr:hypothetical protein [Allorhizocola rhizosphaerae]
MNITELLITGYDGEKAVFAVNLSSNAATMVVGTEGTRGEVIVDSVSCQPTPAFSEVWKVLQHLPVAPVQM